MPSLKNQQTLSQYSNWLSQTEGFFLFDYRGFKNTELAALRRVLFVLGAQVHIVKNTLLKLAQPGLALYGTTASLFVSGDPLPALQVLAKVLSEKGLGFKNGLWRGQPLTTEDILALTRFQNSDAVKTMLFLTLYAPLSGLHQALIQLQKKNEGGELHG